MAAKELTERPTFFSLSLNSVVWFASGKYRVVENYSVKYALPFLEEAIHIICQTYSSTYSF